MKKYVLIVAWSCMIAVVAHAQGNNNKNAIKAGPNDVPDIINAHIPGAPVLQKPQLIMAGYGPMVAKGNGIAAPAFYDWDGDDKKDLLVGEFLTGAEIGPYMGSYIRVYKNIGTNETPKFTEKYGYAFPDWKNSHTAAPLSVEEGCCMGFSPQFADLDNDGRPDLLTGQYSGHATWFKRLEEGFALGEQLPQEGNPDSTNYRLRSLDDVNSQHYWLFSTAAFGDFNGDGLIDMITGGYTLRISYNTGTKDHPFFGHRQFLFTPQGDTLQMKNTPLTPSEQEQLTKFHEPAIMHMISPVVADWDGDGIPDILATNHYKDESMPTVMFFKGVKTAQGPRFERGISLFTAKDGSNKVLPGRWLHASVADWNNDGINDLLIGTSVVTLHNYEFSDYLSWNWEHETGVQKYDPGLLTFSGEGTVNDWVNTYLKAPATKPKIAAKDYLTERHCGYVYVLLGKKQ